TRSDRDWSSDVCSSDLAIAACASAGAALRVVDRMGDAAGVAVGGAIAGDTAETVTTAADVAAADVGITGADYLVAASGTLVLREIGRASCRGRRAVLGV